MGMLDAHINLGETMNKLPLIVSLIATAAFAPACVYSIPSGAAAATRTALDAYVAAPDPAYRWEIVHTLPGDGYTLYVLHMVSQNWRNPGEVDRTEWHHWVTVVKPDKLAGDIAFLFVNGGSNNRPAPDKPDPFHLQLALGTGTVAVNISAIPNQPLAFADGQPRVEDDLVAYTWIKAMQTGDETWPARNPMTKAVVRGMDTASALIRHLNTGEQVNRFVVAGGSKRGWTTWTTAIVDKRVIAIAPAVIDVLNVDLSMRHHYAAYGYWAPAIGDYVHHGVMDWIDTPQYKKLLALEDPYAYRDRLTIPKFILNSAGDQFFLPDSSRFYFDGLHGEKHLRYVPNSDHSLRDTDAYSSLYAFYESIVNSTPRPQFSWEFVGENSIRLTAQTKPSRVTLWQALNENERNFRLDSIGKAYAPTELTEQAQGVYVATVEKPAKGWKAYFVELTFDSGGVAPFKFTTPVRITPDTLPFKDKPIE